jgi:hypothetical protein
MEISWSKERKGKERKENRPTKETLKEKNEKEKRSPDIFALFTSGIRRSSWSRHSKIGIGEEISISDKLLYCR